MSDPTSSRVRAAPTSIWYASTTNGHYYGITLVPYNSSGVRGVPITQVFLAPSSGTAPSAPSIAVETWPGSGGGNWAFPHYVSLKITLGTPVAAGDFLWVISVNPDVLVAVYVLTATDVTNGYAVIVDPGPVYPGTYTYSCLQWSVSGNLAGAAASYNVTMRAGFTLTTPTFTYASATAPNLGKMVSVVVPSNTYPPAATADIQYSLTSSSGPWTDLGSLPVGDAYLAAVPAGYSGTIWVKATVAAPGYTTSSSGTGSTSYP